MNKKSKHTNTRSLSLYNITFFFFILMLLSVPLVFWKGFDNVFDLAKSSFLKAIGGVFIILCSVYLILELKKKKSIKEIWIDKILDPPILLFLLAAILSTIFSVNPYLSFFGNYERQIGLVVYLCLIMIYFFSPLVLNDESKFKLTLLFMEITALFVASLCIVESFGLNPLKLQPPGVIRPVSTVGHPSFSAGFMTLLFPLSALNIAGKKSWTLKIFFPLVIFAGIIATQTRTTYAALTVEILVMAILLPLIYKAEAVKAKKFLIYTAFLLLVLVLCIIAVVYFFPQSYAVKRLMSIADITKQPRWLLWRDSIEMFKHYPLTGTGIAVFSNVFENYATYELRYAEVKGFFDHPHNNVLNTFCTMGVLGGITYLLILFQTVRVSLKVIFDVKYRPKLKLFFLFILCSVIGYMIFGLADFDDITIMLYFFILLALFKVKYFSVSRNSLVFDKLKFGKKIKNILPVILILSSIYFIYSSYCTISAQIYFVKCKEKYNSGDLPLYMNNVRSAINLNSGESFYTFMLAYDIFRYISSNTGISAEIRSTLLEQAKREVTIAEKNYHSRLECLGLLSLIELETGNEQEAMRIRKEMFQTDTSQLPYRINLARYYIRQNRDSAALNEINVVQSWEPKNIDALVTHAMIFVKQNRKEEAAEYCRKILSIDPTNQYARRTLDKLPALKR